MRATIPDIEGDNRHSSPLCPEIAVCGYEKLVNGKVIRARVTTAIIIGIVTLAGSKEKLNEIPLSVKNSMPVREDNGGRKNQRVSSLTAKEFG